MTSSVNDLSDVISKIDPTFGKTIHCEEGWNQLIIELHTRIMDIDPEYRIYQIKEKFGGLRFYFSPSSPQFQQEISRLVSNYERMSYLVCERTGKPGELMKRNGTFKTLHSSFTGEGWTPVENDDAPTED